MANNYGMVYSLRYKEFCKGKKEPYRFNGEDFGKRLKKMIKKAGYTQKSFAKKSGIAVSTLQSYFQKENSKMPKAEPLYNMANILNVSMEFLLTGNKGE